MVMLLFLCLGMVQAWGAEPIARKDTTTAKEQRMEVVRTTRCIVHPLYFHLDDDVVDMDYMGNDSIMRAFRHTVDSVGLNHIDSIRVVVQSSPEGPVAHNFDLSRRRAVNTERYLNKRYPDIMPFTKVVADGESWDALRRFIVTDTVLTSSEIQQLVDILDLTPNPVRRKQRLQAMGKLYRYLYATYYPRLRNSIIATVFTTDVVKHPVGGPGKDGSAGPAPDNGRGRRPRRDTVRVVTVYDDRIPADTIYLRDTVYVHHTLVVDTQTNIYGNGTPVPGSGGDTLQVDTVRHDPLFAIKTNLLFDAITALNGEVEVPIGKRHSLMAESVWPWWLQKSHNRWCFEMGSVSLEYRWWFRPWLRHQTWTEWKQNRRQPLRGAFVGVYVTGGYYDFQWKRHNGYQGEFYSAGLTVGITRYVSRCVRFEFSLSGGYVKDKYRTYVINDNTPVFPDADQHLYRTGRSRNNWFGPTKAKITLSILLHKKCRKQKGGDQ